MGVSRGASRVLVAIGGNSLVESAGRTTVEDQYRVVAKTCEPLADAIAAGVELLIVHGNGPQVGFGLRRSELARGQVPESPLDSIDADTQGALGYMIQQALGNALRQRGLDDRVAAVVTQVLVDPDDDAFKAPAKPIGGYYTEAEARRWISELGWNMVKEGGRGWRRVVPSPRPQRIVESWAMRTLLEAGAVVIGCGGGGVPVVETEPGLYRGVPGVIDKDRAAALLARDVQVDLLVFSTGVDQLFLDFGTPDERPLREVRADEAQRHLDAGQFPAGSMGPKVEACLSFVRAGGHAALITSPGRLAAALRGEAGSRIVP